MITKLFFGHMLEALCPLCPVENLLFIVILILCNLVFN